MGAGAVAGDVGGEVVVGVVAGVVVVVIGAVVVGRLAGLRRPDSWPVCTVVGGDVVVGANVVGVVVVVGAGAETVLAGGAVVVVAGAVVVVAGAVVVVVGGAVVVVGWAAVVVVVADVVVVVVGAMVVVVAVSTTVTGTGTLTFTFTVTDCQPTELPGRPAGRAGKLTEVTSPGPEGLAHALGKLRNVAAARKAPATAGLAKPHLRALGRRRSPPASLRAARPPDSNEYLPLCSRPHHSLFDMYRAVVRAP